MVIYNAKDQDLLDDDDVQIPGRSRDKDTDEVNI